MERDLVVAVVGRERRVRMGRYSLIEGWVGRDARDGAFPTTKGHMHWPSWSCVYVCYIQGVTKFQLLYKVLR